jgi:thioredoxin 1
MAGNVLDVNDDNFDSEVLRATEPVLVDFTATWCGPCKALAPIVESLAAESGGKYKVVKVDVDHAPNTASRFGIRGVPTVMVFQGGERKAQHVGLTNKANLIKLLGV